MQDDFRTWIEIKGADNLAKTFNVSINTVYSWSHRNFIPRTVWPDLMLAHGEVGLSDLLAMEKASRP
jgi:hypothetical protein